MNLIDAELRVQLRDREDLGNVYGQPAQFHRSAGKSRLFVQFDQHTQKQAHYDPHVAEIQNQTGCITHCGNHFLYSFDAFGTGNISRQASKDDGLVDRSLQEPEKLVAVGAGNISRHQCRVDG
ncbi:MAG: hypothetical protein HQ567_35420 [Candidatus Nealsonbacteria bacterium]|nr:hypothetical protein [Candidatus Nealsonbacteria bacterium]